MPCSHTDDIQTVLRIISGKTRRPSHTATNVFNCATLIGTDEQSIPDNLLFHGDNENVLATLLDPAWQAHLQKYGGIKLVYMDPPFAVGTDFSATAVLHGDGMTGHFKTTAYSDKWGTGEDSFYLMLYKRLCLVRELLAEDGTCYVHCDWRTNALTRLLMDAVFGKDRFLGEIIWHYTGGGRAKRYFSRKHDTLLHYAKSGTWTFNIDAVRVPYKTGSGYAKNGIVSYSGKQYCPSPLGTPVDDVWDIPIINPMAAERLEYPTQKPEKLLERIIAASSNPGDIVADFFCGSGTTLAVAARTGRRWIGADAGNLAVQTASARLASIRETAIDDVSRYAAYAFFEENRLEAGQDKKANDTEIAVRLVKTPHGISVQLATVCFRLPVPGLLRVNRRHYAPDAYRMRFFNENLRIEPVSGKRQNTPLVEIAWQRLIHSWSVSVPTGIAGMPHTAAQGCSCVRQVWQTSKSRSRDSLPLGTPALAKINGHPEIIVRVTDIFGAVYRVKVKNKESGE